MKPITKAQLAEIESLPFVKGVKKNKDSITVKYVATKLCFFNFPTTDRGKNLGKRWIYLPEQTMNFNKRDSRIEIRCPIRQPHCGGGNGASYPCLGNGQELITNERNNGNWKGLVWVMWIWIHSNLSEGGRDHGQQTRTLRRGYPVWDKDKKRVPNTQTAIRKMVTAKEASSDSLLGWNLDRADLVKKFKDLKFDEVM